MDGIRMTGAVTAGGRSSRFGSDKALAQVDGHTLLERVCASLRGCSTRLIVAPPERYGVPGWAVVPDTRPGQGPLAGLEAALGAAPPGWVAFAGVDLPDLTAAYWQALCAARTPDALSVQALDPEGRPQPLAALYHTALKPRITALLNSGERRLRLAALPEHTVLVPGLPPLRNVNTPTDLQQ
ncbi:molybdenum cofactor guanylyltransferase [Deinococcus multiflagellatus]|uniref:molybdenum cofactor guanylyltransferase n=1 Tax=Deinococcus multiflagellatus TaxID=1656887 RepID=UPI001CCAF67C|nr:molybdenum cofactor guanylyltransferase [Deinococcus multiflagellatus]MBZ9716081.1 molybdenum cofactor guanylyltransferase [Deinococcus multiflagellatus]